MKITKLFSLIFFICGHFIMCSAQTVSNKLPMYGEGQKSEEQKKIDADFIDEVVRLKGSRQKAAEQFLQRGWAYFHHDSLELSMKRFNQVWLLDPEIPDTYFGFAALTEMKGNEAEARRYYEMGVAKDIKHDRARVCYQKIADCKEQLKDYKGTIKAYDAIIAVDPKNVFAYKKLGYFNSELDNDEAAMQNYNKAIALDPKDATTYLNRGFLYQKLKKLELATADYTKAIIIDPKYINAYANRGMVRMESGDNGGARQDFEKSTTLDPASGQLRRLLGMAKLATKDKKGACADFDKAIELGDEDAKMLKAKLCGL